MKIVCATNMPFAAEAFASLGDVTVKDGRSLKRADVQDADILAVRSTTKVNRELLEGSRVRFVGTATIGTDHLDIPWLEQNGIHWCYAPGCNANSVAEYITAALLGLGRRHGLTLAGKTLGVIGVGNVGSRVAAKATALGMRVMLNDPPRERAQEAAAAGAGLRFYSLSEVVAEADVLTLHVPLTREGPDATRHLAGAAFFRQLKRGAIFINSARGPVVQTEALLAALADGSVAHAVIDTWEGEPAYRHDLLPHVDLATPHIAGYSYDGRVNGTVMVYRAACAALGLAPRWSPPAAGESGSTPLTTVAVDAAGRADEAVLDAVVRGVYDIEADDRCMRATALDDAVARAAAFDQLRKHYPERHEFAHTRVALSGATDNLRRQVAALGFNLP